MTTGLHRRRDAWLSAGRSMAMALLAAVPAVGVGLLALLTVTAKSWRLGDGARVWWWATLPSSMLLALLAAMNGKWDEAAAWLGTFVLNVVLGAIDWGSHKVVVRGVMIALVAFALTGAAMTVMRTLRYGPSLTPFAPDVVTGIGERSFWALRQTSRVAVSLESMIDASRDPAQAGSGTEGWLDHDGVRIAPSSQPTEAGVVRFDFPSTTTDPYAYHRFDVRAPAGGRTFRLSAELRSHGALPERANRGLWLQSWDPAGSVAWGILDVPDAWTPVEAVLTLRPDVASSELLAVVNDFDGSTVEVRNLRLEEFVPDTVPASLDASAAAGSTRSRSDERVERASPGTWQRVPPTVRLVAEGTSLATAMLPTDDARCVTSHTATTLATRDDEGFATVTVRIAANGWSGLSIRDTIVASPGASTDDAMAGDGARWLPEVAFVRVGWWLGHPNIAGHVAVMLTILGLLATRDGGFPRGARWPLSFGLIMAGTTAVITSGSRSSWLALLAFLVVYVIAGAVRSDSRSHVRRRVTVAAAVVSLAGGTWLLVMDDSPLRRGSLLQGTDGNVVLRTTIWSFAAKEIAADPFWGNRGEAFAATWRETMALPPVSHAHNAALTLGARYGLPGAVAGLAPFVVLAVALIRRRAMHGAAIVAAIVVMQTLDDTFWTLRVLGTLSLAIRLAIHGADSRDGLSTRTNDSGRNPSGGTVDRRSRPGPSVRS